MQWGIFLLEVNLIFKSEILEFCSKNSKNVFLYQVCGYSIAERIYHVVC